MNREIRHMTFDIGDTFLGVSYNTYHKMYGVEYGFMLESATIRLTKDEYNIVCAKNNYRIVLLEKVDYDKENNNKSETFKPVKTHHFYSLESKIEKSVQEKIIKSRSKDTISRY
jgi:hypothetical protein